MDLTKTIEAKSDQVNADDLISGPITVTIESVSKGSAEQPVDIHLVERPGKAYRPSKSMRRVLVGCWGKEASVYKGRRMTLYRDPSVKFGGEQVGGIKISHLSDIDGPKRIALTVKRGQRAIHTVEPLTEPKPAPTQQQPTAEDIAACTDIKKLRAWWDGADRETRTVIEDRVFALKAEEAEPTMEDQQ